MKVNKSEKLIWKHKSIPINYLVGILVGSSPCIIFFQVIIIGILVQNKYSFAAGIIGELIAFGGFWIIWYDLGS